MSKASAGSQMLELQNADRTVLYSGEVNIVDTEDGRKVYVLNG